MPTEKFLKLKERKKRIVFEAIEKVLSNNNIDDVSIIEIVNEAGISRGTFYNYFKDKNDAINAYTDSYVDLFFDKFKEIYLEKNGDLIETTREIYLTIRDIFKNQVYKVVLKNINYFNRCNWLIYADEKVDKKMKNYVFDLYESINKEKYVINNMDEMISLSQLLVGAMISALIRYSINVDVDIIDKLFYTKLSIIEKGVKV